MCKAKWRHTHEINHVKDHYLLVTTHTYVLQVYGCRLQADK